MGGLYTYKTPKTKMVCFYIHFGCWSVIKGYLFTHVVNRGRTMVGSPKYSIQTCMKRLTRKTKMGGLYTYKTSKTKKVCFYTYKPPKTKMLVHTRWKHNIHFWCWSVIKGYMFTHVVNRGKTGWFPHIFHPNMYEKFNTKNEKCVCKRRKIQNENGWFVYV